MNLGTRTQHIDSSRVCTCGRNVLHLDIFNRRVRKLLMVLDSRVYSHVSHTLYVSRVVAGAQVFKRAGLRLCKGVYAV